MKKNQPIQVLKVLFLLMTTSIFIGSCKKEMFDDSKLSDTQIIENSKTWYLKEKREVRSKLAANRTLTEITFEPNWETANVENVNGKRIITAQVKTNLSSFSSLGTKYMLMIEEDKKNRSGRIISINNYNSSEKLTNADLYITAFTNFDPFERRAISADIRIFELNYKEIKHLLYTERGSRNIPIISSNIDSFEKESNQKSTSVSITCYEAKLYIWGYDDNGEPAFEVIDFGTFCPEVNLTTISWIEGEGYGSLSPEQQLESLLTLDIGFKQWWQRLNAAEKALLKNYPASAMQVYFNAGRAEAFAAQVYPANTENMHQDAFRHAYWSYLNAMTIGAANAIAFGNAHELGSTPNIQVQMDLHNNGVGANAALEPNAPTNMFAAITYLQNKITSGRMRFIINGVLVPSY